MGCRYAVVPNKILMPSLANTTRELLKAKNCANTAALKELLNVIKYILDMKNLGLKIEPMGDSNKGNCMF